MEKSGYTAENNTNAFDASFIEKVTKIVPFNHLFLTDFKLQNPFFCYLTINYSKNWL